MPFDVNPSRHTSLNSRFGSLGPPVGVIWCLLVSVVVLNCPEIPGGCVCGQMSMHMFMPEKKMFIGFRCDSGCIEVFSPGLVWWIGAAIALQWKCPKRQNFTSLTLLKHQNTKTYYKLSKNHWVIKLFYCGFSSKLNKWILLLSHCPSIRSSQAWHLTFLTYMKA